MADNKLATLKSELPQQLSEAQMGFLQKKTPAMFIKYREGRGGGNFAYVEVGYVMEMLNSLFGFGGWDWEYVLVEQLSFPHTQQIVVNGKLTVRIYDKKTHDLISTIVKTAAGGGTIKTPKGSVTPIDLADDVKSAAADALKKAASLIGIAADVYYPNVYNAKESIKNKQPASRAVITEAANLTDQEQEDISLAEEKQERIALQRGIFTLAKELAIKGEIELLGKTDDEKKSILKEWLGKKAQVHIASFKESPIEQLRQALEFMQEYLK